MDVPLSEAGREHSRRVAERLAGIAYDAIYSSDLQRAVYLAESLARPRGLPVETDAIFRERDMGVLQGMHADRLEREQAELYRPWRADRVYHRVPESENFEDLRARIVPALEALARRHPGGRAALVCHAGPIRVMLAHVIGLPLEHIFRLTVAHGSVSIVEWPLAEPTRLVQMGT